MTLELNIVVGMDFDELGDRALRQALRLARSRGNAAIHIAHALTPADMGSFGDDMEKQSEALEALPKELWQRVGHILDESGIDHDAIPIWQHLRIGDPCEIILQVANDYAAHMVVVGSHARRGLDRLLLGSVAEKLVRAAKLPILVAYPNDLDPEERTPRPAPPATPEELAMHDQKRATHVYSSSLISAWRGIQRSSIPFT